MSKLQKNAYQNFPSLPVTLYIFFPIPDVSSKMSGHDKCIRFLLFYLMTLNFLNCKWGGGGA